MADVRPISFDAIINCASQGGSGAIGNGVCGKYIY